MGKYQLKIRLLSDMCVSDGGVYNSSLDIDICHDEYGFPYIPARRIKGCLRECALELKEWEKSIRIEEIFGTEEKKGALRIRNAYVEGYTRMKEQVKGTQNLIFHPQNILSYYSYIRTQTSIDDATGASKENSLRTMRVVNRGLIFIADIELDEKYEEEFLDVVSIFHYIGMSRTRGMGEIAVTCEPVAKSDDEKTDWVAINEQIEKEGRIRYSIYLEEPLVCKSIGGESGCLDYIQGNKILGIVLQGLKKSGEDIQDFLENSEGLFFSNAYLEEEGVRLEEVPAVYYSIKNNSVEYVNKAYENADNKMSTEHLQLNAMKHCYVGVNSEGKLVTKSVMLEERYHHRRPEDKSIGSASGDKSGIFYQMASIAAGQSFQGYVTGKREQLQKVSEQLLRQKYYQIGNAGSSEYGKVKLTFANNSNAVVESVASETTLGIDILIKLESPAIVYSRENVMYSTNVEDLQEEIDIILGLKGTKPDKMQKFVNYTSVGGYNVTWKKRKPTVEAFDKGTVLIYHFDKCPSLFAELQQNTPVHTVIGERTLEGYGEISICRLEQNESRYIGKLAKEMAMGESFNKKIDVSNSEFAQEICEYLWKEYIKVDASIEAQNQPGRMLLGAAGATIRDMLSMCKEEENWDNLICSVKKRYEANIDKKDEKLKIAKEIVDVVDKRAAELPSMFREHYAIEGWERDVQGFKLAYLHALLIELKYRIREKKHLKGGSKYES